MPSRKSSRQSRKVKGGAGTADHGINVFGGIGEQKPVGVVPGGSFSNAIAVKQVGGEGEVVVGGEEVVVGGEEVVVGGEEVVVGGEEVVGGSLLVNVGAPVLLTTAALMKKRSGKKGGAAIAPVINAVAPAVILTTAALMKKRSVKKGGKKSRRTYKKK